MDRLEVFKIIALQASKGELTFPANVKATMKLQEALDDPDCHIEAAARMVMAEPLLSARASIRVAQAVDDPLASMLAKLEAERPDIPVERLGAAQMGLPELQADGFADAALRFAEAVDSGST